MRSLFAMAVAGWLVGCSSMPPPDLAPVGEIETGAALDLSGDYCFSGDPAALHAYGKVLQNLPFVEWTRVLPGSLVRLVHRREEALEFSYTTTDGITQQKNFDLRRKGVRWEKNRLVYRPQDDASGVRLGLSASKFEYALYRFRDGRLVVHSMSSEAGLAFLVVPFRERYEAYLELAPPGPEGCTAYSQSPGELR